MNVLQWSYGYFIEDCIHRNLYVVMDRIDYMTRVVSAGVILLPPDCFIDTTFEPPLFQEISGGDHGVVRPFITPRV